MPLSQLRKESCVKDIPSKNLKCLNAALAATERIAERPIQTLHSNVVSMPLSQLRKESHNGYNSFRKLPEVSMPLSQLRKESNTEVISTVSKMSQCRSRSYGKNHTFAGFISIEELVSMPLSQLRKESK